MDGIRVRGNRYRVDVTVGGIRRTKTVGTMDQAKLAHAELRAELLRGIPQEEREGTWTLQQALDKAKLMAWSDKISGDKLHRNAEMVVDIIGASLPVTKVTTEMLYDVSQQLLEAGNSNATVNRKMAAVSKLLTVAMDCNKLTKKPKIPHRNESEHRIRFLSRDEELTCLSILEQWSRDEHAEAFCVLIDTGIRPSELWRIEARDFDHQVINFWKTKNHRARSVPMTARVGDIMLRRSEMTPQGPLFPYDDHWFLRTWDRMKAHMKLSEDVQFIPYALRHTCLSRLVQRGVPLKVVQEWAGHTNIATTMRYAHLCPTNLLDAVKVLETT